MSISINREHMKNMADELGFEIEFNTDNPGMLALDSGEIYDFEEVLLDFLSEDETKEFFTEEKLPQVKVISYKPVKVSMNSDNFFFTDKILSEEIAAS